MIVLLRNILSAVCIVSVPSVVRRHKVLWKHVYEDDRAVVCVNGWAAWMLSAKVFLGISALDMFTSSSRAHFYTIARSQSVENGFLDSVNFSGYTPI